MPRTPLGTMASKYGHGSGDISSFYRAAQQVSCPNRPFGRWADVGQRKNGRSGENFLSTAGCAWAVLGGIPSGWGQFGAVKKWAVLIGGLRRQLNALYLTKDGLAATSPIRISTCVPGVRMRIMRSRQPALPAPPHPLMRVAAATSASPRRPGCTRLSGRR